MKAIETIVINIAPNLIYGRRRLRLFYIEMNKKGIAVAISRYVKRRRMSMFFNQSISGWSSIFSNYFYRWFILTPSLAISTLLVNDNILIWCISATILFSITVEIINEFVERFWNGIASNIHFNAYVNIANTKFDKIELNASEIMKRIGIALILRFAVIWVGFAGVYYNINEQQIDSFTGMNEFIDALYFSLVTITTTGYGEILPTSILSKLLVLCQMALSWLLLLVMLFHYGATVTNEFDTTEPNKLN
ncbi:MAG: potassium channel family protein [Candidatus Thiodiazotropha sp. (ex Lucinoma borealis)]|nr:potassium channel family protein [Candidatus Thiodiazotropha sp. (ex Lucinoma borealis)]